MTVEVNRFWYAVLNLSLALLAYQWAHTDTAGVMIVLDWFVAVVFCTRGAWHLGVALFSAVAQQCGNPTAAQHRGSFRGEK